MFLVLITRKLFRNQCCATLCLKTFEYPSQRRLFIISSTRENLTMTLNLSTTLVNVTPQCGEMQNEFIWQKSCIVSLKKSTWPWKEPVIVLHVNVNLRYTTSECDHHPHGNSPTLPVFSIHHWQTSKLFPWNSAHASVICCHKSSVSQSSTWQ